MYVYLFVCVYVYMDALFKEHYTVCVELNFCTYIYCSAIVDMSI